MAAEGDPALEAADDAAADPRPLPLLALRHARRPSSRTRRRPSASTRRAGDWATDLLERLDDPDRLLPEVVAPGTPLGAALADVAEETGLGRRAGRSRSRRTTPAPPSPPCRSRRPAPSSSASARGRSSVSRSTEPRDQRRHVRREPDERGRRRRDLPAAPQRHRPLAARRVPPQLGRRGHASYAFDELVALAAAAPPLRSFVDPNDPIFLEPGDMPARIRAFCRADGPDRAGRASAETVRCILESLALKHARDDRPARAVTGVDTERAARRRRRRAQRAALRAGRPSAAGLPVLAGPGGGDVRRQPARAGDRARRDRRRSHEAREVVRASFEPAATSPRPTPAGRRRGSASPGSRAARAGGDRMSETWRAARDSRAREPVGVAAASRADVARRARLPLEPARRRPGAREQRRRQHLGEGDGRRPRRPRGARALGEGLRHRSRDDHGRRLPRAAARRAPAAARARRRWTTRDGRRTCCAARCARISRGRRSRRCCTRSSRRRTSTTRTPTR